MKGKHMDPKLRDDLKGQNKARGKGTFMGANLRDDLKGQNKAKGKDKFMNPRLRDDLKTKGSDKSTKFMDPKLRDNLKGQNTATGKGTFMDDNLRDDLKGQNTATGKGTFMGPNLASDLRGRNVKTFEQFEEEYDDNFELPEDSAEEPDAFADWEKTEDESYKEAFVVMCKIDETRCYCYTSREDAEEKFIELVNECLQESVDSFEEAEQIAEETGSEIYIVDCKCYC